MGNKCLFKLIYSMVIVICLFTMRLYSQPEDFEGTTAGGVTICAAAPAYDEKGGFLLAGYTTGDEKGGPIYWVRITRYGNVLWQGGNESHPDLENLGHAVRFELLQYPRSVGEQQGCQGRLA